MKKLVIILLAIINTTISMAQQNKKTQSAFDKLWTEVQASSAKNATKDAIATIEKIIAKAKAENNTAEKIKAICAKQGFAKNISEDANEKNIAFLEKEILAAKNIEKQIWHSLIADIYLQTYQQNRWKILERTKLQTPSTNIKEWNAEQYFTTISNHLEASLSDRETLKKTPTSAFRTIIREGKNKDDIYKTVYEVLLDKALNFYINDEIELTKPVYTFTINANDGFADASTFIKTKFTSEDKFSAKMHALQLYQELMQYYNSTNNTNGWIDADVARLDYVYNHCIDAKKKILYINALNIIYEKNPTNKYAAIAKLSVVGLIKDEVSEGNYFGYSNEENYINYKQANKRLEAKNICEQILKNHSDSTVQQLVKYHLQNITQQKIKLTTEKTYLPNETILANISYQNCKKVYCYILPIKHSFEREYGNEDEQKKKLQLLSKLKPIVFNLPNADDLLAHSTDVALPSLSAGMYKVIITNSDKLSNKNILSATNFIAVSNIGFTIINRQYIEQDRILVANRKTGEPIANATINLYINNYNNTTNKYQITQLKSVKTNANGMYSAPFDLGSCLLEIIHGKDTIYANDEIYFSSEAEVTNTTINKLILFTDRNIYRPNHVIYFKGIYIKQNDSANNYESQIVSNTNLQIDLHDANGKVVATKILKTNEYGSIADSFKIPEGLLSGAFTIQHTDGSVSVQVEEYKRPKFEIVTDTLTKTYQVNENIVVTGTAKAYAGNGLQDALVKYSVQRKTRFIYDWCRWGGFNNDAEVMQIADGELKTDADGKFSMSFLAIPDDEIERSTSPIFDYEISIDVTDANGETHNKTITISAGYQAIQLNVEVPEKIKQKNFTEIKINTTNMNDAFVASKVNIACYALKNIGSNKKNKLWKTPDQFIMSESEFAKQFPTEAYKNETDCKTWPKEKTIFTKTITTTQDGMVKIEDIPNQDIYCLIEISTVDKSGDTLLEKKYVRVVKNTNAKPISNEDILISKTNKNNELEIALPENVNHVLEIQAPYKIEPISVWKTAEDFKNTVNYNLNKKDLFGRNIYFGYFFNNRFYESQTQLFYPKAKKNIQLNITTFRDKLTPGEDQKWTVNISGADKDAVNTELMTSMYDASLDELYNGEWYDLDGRDYRDNDREYGEIFSNNDNSIENNEDMENDNYFELIRFNKSEKDELLNFILNKWMIYRNGIEAGTYAMTVSDANGFVAKAAPRVIATLSSPPLKSMVKFTPPVIKKDEEEKEGAMHWSNANKPTSQPAIRKNFQETAFWFPQLHTDKDGNISFTFTTPDALTKWRWRMLAHTQALQSATEEKYITTQKELMVVTNNPRFYREGDAAIYTSKVVNTSNKAIAGNLHLEILQASNEKNCDALFSNTKNNILFKLNPGESTSINFALNIPSNNAVPILAKIIATATSPDGSSFSDGEQNGIPILPNNQMVTEAKAFAVRGGQTKNVALVNLLNTNETQNNYSYTIETTSNPTWYAVQSLPYMAEFPYECAEQTFNRFFAYQIGSHIMNSNPLIAKVLDAWKTTDTAALLSNLEKNQELKSVLLQETPWLMEAKNETEQKHQLALLLDMQNSAAKSKLAYDKLAQMQTPEGGFTWFPGMPANAFITQYILTGFGKLMHLQVLSASELDNNYPIVGTALAYLDREIVKNYQWRLKAKAMAKKNAIYYEANEMQYLYMRSFYNNVPTSTETKKAIDFYIQEASKNIFKQSLSMQAMSAIAMHRFGKKELANQLLKGITQNAITTDEDGMYWKENASGYNWYQAPIETQSLLIECFEEIAHDTKSIDEMKIWLLKNKQTNHWPTTKSTADAVYAMLLRGTNFLATNADLQIKVGTKQLAMKDYPAEAGTGYTKIHFGKSEITPSMGNVQITNTNNQSPIAWGAVYYQYFQNLDKIKNDNGDIALEKKLFLVTKSATGEVLNIIPNAGLKPGDRVRVRIVLIAKQDMDFVHMKDMRAACFEPLNVISSYKYNNGLGYYESTKDVATHFFFDHINKGTYVFEYDLFATNKGNYSNGITNIECMYAPELQGHSEGVRVMVK